MFLQFALRKKRGKRETAKPRFLVLRRRTLTVGAALLAAAMMLRYSFDMAAEADTIEAAVDQTLKAGIRCGDIMQAGCTLVGCREMGAEIRSRI